MRLVVALALLAGVAHAGDPPPSTADVKQIAVVSGRSCALHADGKVSCWGDNERELLGPGKEPRPAPIGVPAFSDVVQLEGMFFGTCALRADHTVACLGMTAASKATLEVQPLTDVIALRHTCALHGSGAASCFDGKRWTKIAGVSDAIDVDSSDGRTGCVVHRDHTVSCFAEGNSPASIGAGADGTRQPIAGVRDAVEVAAGMFFACARLKSNAVTCWGSNGVGELGRGRVDDMAKTDFTPAAAVPGLRDAVQLIAGPASMCARRATGALACWGAVGWEDRAVTRPTTVLDHVIAYATGDQHCAVVRGRDVRCWGSNRQGEVGDGTGGIAAIARLVPKLTDAIQLDSSNLASCALRKTGDLRCWGYQAGPKFGGRKLQHVTSSWGTIIGLARDGATWVSGETKARPTPHATTLSGACSIVNPGANGGEVWCSANVKGAQHNPVVTRIGTFTDAVELAGNESVCIRRRAGQILCVTGAFVGNDEKIAASITDPIALAAADHTRCVVRSDHSVWCWGQDDSVLFGGHQRLHPVDSAKPVPPTKMPFTNAVSVAIGGPMDSDRGEIVCSIKVDGTVWCMGSSHDGRLGTVGGPDVITTPVQIRGVADATQLSLGWVSGCALQRNGTVACWGSNEDGELGTPPSKDVLKPVAVKWSP